MHDFLTNIAAAVDLPINVVKAGMGVAALLALGSVIRWIKLRSAPIDERKNRLGSLLVWWGMLVIVVFTVCAGKIGGVITFGTLSLIALYEYFRMLDKKQSDPRGRGVLWMSVPAMYASILFTEGIFAQTFVLVATTMGVSIRLLLAGKTNGYLETASALTWGSIVFVFFLCHAALLLALPSVTNPVAGSAGWFIFLIVFTECDDIFQAIFGRRFGRHKITPDVSPNKTWEGFIFGGLAAIAIGFALAPLLTPLAQPWPLRVGEWSMQVPYLGALLAGIILCVAGFFGDLNESALKRDAGVKDSGNWLPSQGGILDRIDSLTFTAPAFYYFVVISYG